MRRINFINVMCMAAALTTGAAFTACNGSKMETAHEETKQEKADKSFASETNGTNIQFVSFEDSIIIELPSMTELVGKPSYATMATTGVFPISWGNVDIKPLQQRITQVAYGTNNIVLKEAIEHYALHPALVEDNETVMLAPPTLLNDSTMSEQQAVIAIESMDRDLLSMSIYSYTYPYGAAHGNYGTTYINFFIPTAQVLDQTNLFKEDKHNDIIKIIRKNAKELYPYSGSMVDPSEINSFENFYITPSSVTFVYAPYEIA
ncbi:MAG: RsiV family protein, partial [Muribaculaceae bacterium]|nr:RsiV family protein [Muribaculaceae bacterium]